MSKAGKEVPEASGEGTSGRGHSDAEPSRETAWRVRGCKASSVGRTGTRLDGDGTPLGVTWGSGPLCGLDTDSE